MKPIWHRPRTRESKAHDFERILKKFAMIEIKLTRLTMFASSCTKNPESLVMRHGAIFKKNPIL